MLSASRRSSTQVEPDPAAEVANGELGVRRGHERVRECGQKETTSQTTLTPRRAWTPRSARRPRKNINVARPIKA